MAGGKFADTTVRRFVYGAALAPPAKLLAWLEATRGRRLRLPVVLARGPVGFLLNEARLGAAADALKIRCDDSALGVGLAERARYAAGAARTVALRLEGRWQGGEARVFAVVKVGEVVERDDLEEAAAEVEADAGTGDDRGLR